MSARRSRTAKRRALAGGRHEIRLANGVLFTLVLGLALGFLGSMPSAGPVGMFVVSEAVSGRPRAGLHAALGSAVAESAYAFVAFWGFAMVLARFPHLVSTSRFLACVALVAMGLYLLVRGGAPRPTSALPDRGGPRSALLGF